MQDPEQEGGKGDVLLGFCQADGAGAHGAELLPLAQCSAALWWNSEVLMLLTFVFKDVAGGVTSALVINGLVIDLCMQPKINNLQES